MGLSLVIYGVAIVVRPGLISRALASIDHESFATLAMGFLGVVAGLAIVLSHNVWDGSWRVLISLYGWAALIKGALYLASPQTVLGMGRKVWGGGWAQVLPYVVIALGAFLAYKGFGY